jgi:hypothetical protein
MKKILIILPFFLLCAFFIFFGCKSKSSVQPCDNKGTICIENKLDTVLTVYITELHQTLSISKDFTKCVDLSGDQAYTFSLSSSLNYHLDTAIFISICDKKLILIRK